MITPKRHYEGEMITLPHEYNGYFDKVNIKGKSEQDSDWYAADGESTQVQSVWATNLITNGDFSSGAINWNYTGTRNAISINSRIEFNGTATGYGGYFQDISIPTGNKLYIGYLHGRGNDTVGFVSIYDYSSFTNTTTLTVNIGLNTSIIDAKTNGIRLYLRQIRDSTYINAWIDNIVIIDLTAIFGAGKEPTKAQMDAMLAQYPNSWFDGKAQLTTDVSTYVPNSPTLSYPSQINTYLPSGEYKITTTDGIYETNIEDDLMGLPTNKDKVVFDKVGKKGNIEKRVRETIIDGTEEWIKEGEEQQTDNTTLFSTDIDATSDEILSTHFKNIDVVEEPVEITESGTSLTFNNTYNDFVDRLEIEGKSNQSTTTETITNILAPHIIPFHCGAGVFDMQFNDMTNARWLYNGNLYTDSRLQLTTLDDEVVWLLVDEFLSNSGITNNSITQPIKLDLSDLQGKITYYLNLYNCKQITGSLADLQGKITYQLTLSNCNQITGSLADLQGKITYYLSLNNCPQITGSLADLQGKITYALSLSNCNQITGAYIPVGDGIPTFTYLDKTGISPEDMDTTLIAYANTTKNNGTFSANGMSRTHASDEAVNTLISRGWAVTGMAVI